MFRLNDIIDLPLLQGSSEQRLCTIKDVIIDMRESRVYALVCKERLLKRSMEVMPYKNVVSISQNGVVAAGSCCQLSLRELQMKQRRFQSYNNILGKLVTSTKGETLGIIRDLLIDTNSGIIKAFELSEGYIDDILKGRHIIELERGHKLTGKNIVLMDCSRPDTYMRYT